MLAQGTLFHHPVPQVRMEAEKGPVHDYSLASLPLSLHESICMCMHIVGSLMSFHVSLGERKAEAKLNMSYLSEGERPGKCHQEHEGLQRTPCRTAQQLPRHCSRTSFT